MAIIDFDSLPLFPGDAEEQDMVVFKDTSTGQFFRIQLANIIVTSDLALTEHKQDLLNPHQVTATQVGLGNVTDDAQLKIASNLSDLSNTAIALNNLGGVSVAQFSVHSTNTNNPHSVTASQVGSYTEAEVDALLLDKAPVLHVTDTANPHGVTAAQVGNTVAQWNADQIQDITVDASNAANNRALIFNSATGNIEFADQTGSSGGITAIGQASDVSLGLISDLDILVYDNNSSAFINLNFAAAGLTALTDFTNHTSDPNPHSITPTTIGLENVLNQAQLVATNDLSDISIPSNARMNLGLGDIATQDSSSIIITGGTISGTDVTALLNPIAIGDGGTGAIDAPTALTNLGAVPLSLVGIASGVAPLDIGLLVPEVHIPDIEKGETLTGLVNSVTIPVNENRFFRFTLDDDYTVVNPLDINQKSGDYLLYIEQDGVGGHTLAFDGNFILMNFPPAFVMPTDPDEFIQVRLIKVENDSNFYAYLLPDAYTPIPGTYAETFGDGVLTSFVINHGLGTRDVTVQIYDNGTFLDSVPTTLARTDVDNVTITYTVAPTLDQLRVVIRG